MLIGPNQNLEDHLVAILAKSGMLTLGNITERLKHQGVSATPQGIYRVLRKLQTEGALVKEKKTFSLNIAWIRDLAVLVDSMEQTYRQETYLHHLLPKKIGEMRRWRFTNHFKLCDFWSQILISMARQHQSVVATTYCPHAWFDLVHRDQEDQYYDVLFENIKKDYTVIGGRTLLDRYTANELKKMTTEECYLATPAEYPSKDLRQYVSVIGDFVLTITLDTQMAKQIEAFYNRQTDPAMINSPAFFREVKTLFKQRRPIKVILKRDPIKAKKIYKKFESLYGPLQPRGNTPS